MRTFLIFPILLFAACTQPERPEQLTPAISDEGQAVEAPAPEEAQPMSATITAPTVYASYHLVRGAGAIATTGATYLQTYAWQAVPAGQAANPEKFIQDLIRKLDDDGVLAGVDLTKTKSNWLIVLHPGATPRKGWVLDSRDMKKAEPAPQE